MSRMTRILPLAVLTGLLLAVPLGYGAPDLARPSTLAEKR